MQDETSAKQLYDALARQLGAETMQGLNDYTKTRSHRRRMKKRVTNHFEKVNKQMGPEVPVEAPKKSKLSRADKQWLKRQRARNNIVKHEHPMGLSSRG